MISKRGVVLFFGLLLIFNIFMIYAQETAPGSESSPVSDSDVRAIQNITEQMPLDESGNIDPGKIAGWKTKAEERIDAINLWLETNASWLKVVFGMVPSISWLFAVNLYILLFFFVSMVLNGDSLWMFLDEKYAKIFGLVVFIVLDVIKFFTNILAIPAYGFWTGLITWFWSWGWIIAVLLTIILVILLVVLIIYFPGVLVSIHKAIKARKLQKEMDKAKNDCEALGALVGGIQEGSK